MAPINLHKMAENTWVYLGILGVSYNPEISGVCVELFHFRTGDDLVAHLVTCVKVQLSELARSGFLSIF